MAGRRGGFAASFSFAFSLAAIILTVSQEVATTPVNVALKKEVNAFFTCGSFGKEMYWKHADIDKQAHKRVWHNCETPSVHPPQNLVDGDEKTWWQSTSRHYIENKANFSAFSTDGLFNISLQAVIKIDLKQVFAIEKLILIMGAAGRPGEIAVYTGTLPNQYGPKAYKVSKTGVCTSNFKLPVRDVPVSAASPVCAAYASFEPKVEGETITFDFTQVPIELREWKKVRHLQIGLYHMPEPYAFEGDAFQHYAVSEIQVMAECVCNGHATGCKPDSGTGIYVCVCGGNTMGEFCEKCQPFYNQKAFAYKTPCEACNCHKHATACFHNPAIEASNGSLNAVGVRSGGGVCLSCQHHTAGVNCEKCEKLYYRPQGRLQTAENACVKCDCNTAGSTNSPLTNVKSDCVTNSGMILSLPVQDRSKKPGDCFCKANVMGSKCDQCKPGFYNIKEENAAGCQACACFASGTIGASQICTGDNTGQCPCKTNVEGRGCNVCKNEFYKLDTANLLGCTPCNCDPGGATSPICNKDTGMCSCRPNLVQQQCTSPNGGFYYPDLHFIHAELEKAAGVRWERKSENAPFFGDGYAINKPGVSMEVSLVFPGGTALSGGCTMLIRYRSDKATGGTLQLVPEDKESAKVFDLRPQYLPMPACQNKWCYVNTLNTRNFTLKPELYRATVVVTEQVLLDRIVCVPVEFLDPVKVLKKNDFSTYCQVLENDMKIGKAQENICKKGVFSLTTYYLNGPKSCSCDKDGSRGATCAPYGGKCECKPGVGGRKCDECLPSFYSLSSVGCKVCNCSGDLKVCDKLTGQCKCPSNTIGQRCDRCAVNHYGWNSKTGCQPCNCDPLGSISKQCDLKTGLCVCKTGVHGAKCNECASEFKGFGSLGCSPCGCSDLGSASKVCNKTNGQCQCDANVRGLLCDTCKPGSFYQDKGNPKGCLDCICMGVSSTCSSSNQRQQLTAANLVQSKDGKVSPAIILVNQLGAPHDAVVTITNGNVPISLQVDISGAFDYFWKMPLQGNLLGIYNSVIKADVSYSPKGTAGVAMTGKSILVGRNNVRLVHNFKAFNAGNKTTLNTVLSEASWKTESKLESVTRGQFLMALTDVKLILIPVRHTSVPHFSRLLRVEYSIVGNTGPVGLSVEQCQCGPGFQGLSCEQCSPGYKRANVTSQGYLGVCVPCECNGHATLCDPDTGACKDCQHGTTGLKCEQCKDGFYGNAVGGTASDCKLCPCFKPRVANFTCFLDKGVPKCSYCNEGYVGNQCDRCLTFYYGNPHILNTGTCTKCNCNGNSQTCDAKTGQCSNCQSNTVGFNCERCLDGFYGDASNQTCKACGCSAKGSNSTVCDHKTGQCPCHVGVGNRICDSCQPGFYAYNDNIPGCLPCRCVEAGRNNIQCNPVTGVCVCKSNVVQGGKCDKCVAGFFGLPEKPCEACGCNAVGTVGGATGACNGTVGQCPCKQGVTGRSCNQCMRLYHGFGENGCKACGQCPFSLGNDTKVLEESWNAYYVTTQKVAGMQAQDNVLQDLEKQLNTTQKQLGLSDSSITSLSKLMSDIANKEKATNTTVVNLITKTTALQASVESLKANSASQLTRITVLLSASKGTLDMVKTETFKGNNYQYKLREFNTSATQLKSQGKVTGNLGLNFDSEKKQASDELVRIRGDNSVKDMQTKIKQQDSQITTLLAQGNAIQTEYTSSSSTVTYQDNQLTVLLSQETAVVAAQNTAKVSKQQAEKLLSEITQSQGAAEKLVNTMEKVDFPAAELAHAHCEAIRSGNALTAMSNVSSLPAGVTNWDTGSKHLETLLTQVQAQLTTKEADLLNAERKADALTVEANTLNTTYMSVKPKGDAAVKAIQNFEKVIKTLKHSLETAYKANDTIRNARQFLANVTVATLEQEAKTSKAQSEQLRNMLNSLNYESTILESRLQSSNTTLNVAKAEWATVDLRLTQMTNTVNALKTLSSSKSIDDKISNARSATSRSQALGDGAVTTAGTQLASLVTKAAEVNTKKSQEVQARTLISTVETGYEDLKKKVDVVKGNVATIQTHQAETLKKRATIDEKIASIEKKLTQAKLLLGKIKQPVHFNGTTSVSAPNTAKGLALPYDEISFEFRKDPGVVSGLLFFAENTVGGAKLAVQLNQGKVKFDFDTNVDAVQILNPAIICDGCWAKVLASRYENVGHLTVTLLRTGGLATTYARGLSSSARTLTLNTPLYFGSLPTSVTTKKINNVGLKGCMQKVIFNAQEVNIWQEAVNGGQQPQCCRRPTTTITPLPAGVNFDGFGYLILKSSTLDLSQVPVVMIITFRTFNPNAALFKVENGQRLKYAIFLENGYVVFEYGNQATGISNRMRSSKQYHHGQWSEVTATRYATQFQLKVQLEGQGSTQLDNQLLTAQQVDLSPLKGLDIIIGTDGNPSLSSYKPSTKNFAGCIKRLSYTSGPSSPAVNRLLTDGVVKQSGVLTNGCPASVVSGLKFLKTSSYAQINPETEVTNIRSVKFKLITSEPSGLLLYLKDPVVSTRELYFGLFHGNLVIQFTSVQTSTFATRGLYLSDRREHNITLDFTEYRAKLEVNGFVYKQGGNTLSSPSFIFSQTTPFYIGGVPASVTLNNNFPARKSLVGGIHKLAINDKERDVFSNGILISHDSVSLAGIASAKTTLPPTPYPTNKPSVTEPPPTCGTPSKPEYRTKVEGLYFNVNSYFYQTLSSVQLSYFQKSFILSVDIEVYAPEGILFFIGNVRPVPTKWFTMYISKGYIYISVKSGADLTIKSKQQYNNGERYRIDVLMDKSYLALTEVNRKDFSSKSSGNSPIVLSDLNTPSFVGGVDSTVQLSHPTLAFLPKTNFVGAIYGVLIKTSLPPKEINYDLRKGNGSFNIGLIPKQAYYGLSLNGQRSYIEIGDQSTSDKLTIKLKLITTVSSANLVTFYQSSNHFIVFDLQNHKLRALLSSPASGTFISASKDKTVICDGKPHNLVFIVAKTSLSIQVDNHVAEVSPYPSSFTPPVINSMPIFIGGLKNPAVSFVEPVSTESLKGCILEIQIDNGRTSTGDVKDPSNIMNPDPTKYLLNSFGASNTCPY